MTKARPPGPREAITDAEGRPTEVMLAWMRDVTRAAEAAAARVEALVAHLVDEDVIEEGWDE